MLTAKDFLTKKVFTAKDSDSVQKVAAIMAKKDISSVVILNAKKNVIGIMTERDMVRDVLNNPDVNFKAPIKDYLTSPVNMVDEDSDVVILSRYLINNKLKRLIVTRDGKMIGILTQTDMLRASLELVHELHKKLMLGEFDQESYEKRLSKIYGVVSNLSTMPNV